MPRSSVLRSAKEVAEMYSMDVEVGVKKVLLRKNEAASLCNCSPDTVERLLESGVLEGISISPNPKASRKLIRITTRSVEAFINKRRKG